jgi:hypothetical protein
MAACRDSGVGPAPASPAEAAKELKRRRDRTQIMALILGAGEQAVNGRSQGGGGDLRERGK